MVIAAAPDVVPTAPAPPLGPSVVRIELNLGHGIPDQRILRLLWTLEELVHAVGGERVHVAGTPAGRVERSGTATPVRIYLHSRTVRRGGEQVDLTRREFELLRFLAEHPRQVFTRQQLLRQVWGDERATGRTVDVHVRRLRMKLASPGNPLIATLRGVGYRLATSAEVSVVPAVDAASHGSGLDRLRGVSILSL